MKKLNSIPVDQVFKLPVQCVLGYPCIKLEIFVMKTFTPLGVDSSEPKPGKNQPSYLFKK